MTTRTAIDPSLAHECRVFCRYLVGIDPSPELLDAYQRAHDRVGSLRSRDAHSQGIVAFARYGMFTTRLADAYARVFARNTLLRHKLVMLLAIIECHPESRHAIDPASSGPLWWTLARLVGSGTLSILCVLAGAALLLPHRIISTRHG